MEWPDAAVEEPHAVSRSRNATAAERKRIA
jgi:hypothetical protein